MLNDHGYPAFTDLSASPSLDPRLTFAWHQRPDPIEIELEDGAPFAAVIHQADVAARDQINTRVAERLADIVLSHTDRIDQAKANGVREGQRIGALYGFCLGVLLCAVVAVALILTGQSVLIGAALLE